MFITDVRVRLELLFSTEGDAECVGDWFSHGVLIFDIIWLSYSNLGIA